MAFWKSKREVDLVDDVISPRFKYQLAFGMFYIPLFRTFVTLAITGLITYGTTTQLNANLGGNERGVGKMNIYNVSHNITYTQCADIVECGVVALIVQFLLILPLALVNLSSGCRVLSKIPIRFKPLTRHRNRLVASSIVALVATSLACFFSRKDYFVLFSMTPLIVFNMVEIWFVYQLILTILNDQVGRSWDVKSGNDLIATNEQWRSLMQSYEEDDDDYEDDEDEDIEFERSLQGPMKRPPAIIATTII